jgi:predicted nucleic-acid-binding Zn-ribbon protein
VNKMEQWHCFKCREKIVEGSVRMTYLGRAVPIGGMKCPKCGAAYLPEETVVGRVVKAEKMIENK